MRKGQSSATRSNPNFQLVVVADHIFLWNYFFFVHVYALNTDYNSAKKKKKYALHARRVMFHISKYEIYTIYIYRRNKFENVRRMRVYRNTILSTVLRLIYTRRIQNCGSNPRFAPVTYNSYNKLKNVSIVISGVNGLAHYAKTCFLWKIFHLNLYSSQSRECISVII